MKRARRLLGASIVAVIVLSPAASTAATIEVTTLDDERAVDGDCSLREAMQSANDNVSADECAKGRGAERDTIKLQPAEYDLTGPSSDEDENADGDLDYTGGGALTIRGAKGGGSVIDSETDDRVIHAVENASALKLERLMLERGDASTLDRDDGGNVYVGEGALTLSRARISGGTAGSGGGVFFASDERLRIDRSQLFGNEAISGGALNTLGTGRSTVSRSYFSENGARAGASRGGAITYSGDSLKVSDTFFLDNVASSTPGGSALGGAIYGSNLDIRRSLFWGNETQESGENVIAAGGAIDSNGGTRIANTTFYDNASADAGGALVAEGALSHVTFLANSAEDGGDHVAPVPNVGAGPLVVRNSIFPGAAIAVDLCDSDGTVVSKGFSVATYDDPDCGFLDSDLTGVGNPGLEPGAPFPHGGRTWTIPITKSSPAKDLVPKRKCRSAGGTDQRGFERPAGPRCDAGAFERGAKP
ncbi:MAG: CSLREA domain-containing protein [Actinomycetota bacterium]|nr:CSLREA domain-containing protein [Actinomycetota bacterium]